MKRFLISLAALITSMAILVVGTVVIDIWSWENRLERVYRIGDKTDVIFIGASEIGCSIVESPIYHNRVFWKSGTPVQSFLCRLKELERRKQLGNIKVCVVPFGLNTVRMQVKNDMLDVWRRELPVTWRHCECFPFTYGEMVGDVLKNLRWPLSVAIQEEVPQRDSICAKDAMSRAQMITDLVSVASGINEIKGDYEGWKESLLTSYQEMSRICRRNQIRFVIIQPPLLQEFAEAVPIQTQQQVGAFVDRLKACGMEYFETPRDLPDSFFFDNLHLVRAGADRYTQDLYFRLGLPIYER